MFWQLLMQTYSSTGGNGTGGNMARNVSYLDRSDCVRTRRAKTSLTVLIGFLLPSLIPAWGASLPPSGLLSDFLGDHKTAIITDSTPEFSWIVNSTDAGENQVAYQIVVSSSIENSSANIGDMWNSGWVVSGQSINVAYAGTALLPNTSYWWKVNTRLEKGGESEFSGPAQFNTGNLDGPYQTSRYPLVTESISPVEIIRQKRGHYFVDFGRAAFGTVGLNIDKPSNGNEIDIHLGEKRSGYAVDRSPGGTIRYRKTHIDLISSQNAYQAVIPPDKKNTGSKAIRIPENLFEVMPFRYAELHGVPGNFNESSIRQIGLFYPFDESSSGFTSSDETLNGIWDLSKYSIKATSFAGVYVDGDRERIPYEADAYLNQLSHYAVDREFSLARFTHEYLMDNPTWPTEWKQHSVFMAWADYMNTGNLESLRQFYDQLKAEKTLEQHARADGLLDTRGLRDIVDWPKGERDGYVFRNVNTVVNAFYYRTLVLMSDMALALGKQEDAASYETKASQLYKAFNSQLWDPERGVYVDGEGTRHSSLHANLFALAFDLVPAQRSRSTIDFVKSRGMACSVYAAQYLLEALYKVGEDQYALELMTNRGKRGWQNMIDTGSTVTLEAWDKSYKKNLDWNHAWGAAPANIIPRGMFGIQPLEAGFGRIQIKPQTGALQSASITTPTIRGPVSVTVNWSESSYDTAVSIPANTTADVYIPGMDIAGSDLVVDGIITKGKVVGTFILLEHVGSGTTRISRIVPSRAAQTPLLSGPDHG